LVLRLTIPIPKDLAFLLNLKVHFLRKPKNKQRKNLKRRKRKRRSLRRRILTLTPMTHLIMIHPTHLQKKKVTPIRKLDLKRAL